MAAPVILVEATPRQSLDAAPVTVRLAGGGGAVPYYYGGQHWRAGIAGLPKSSASIDFDGEQLGGGGSGEAIEVRWAPSTRAAMAELSALYWTDAPITVRVGPEGADMPPVITTGLVMETGVEGGALRIALGDQASDLKRPLLVDRFAGTGGLEGPPEFTDLIKSRAWGRCFNVPGRQIDAANNIWCFGDPRRPWRAFDAVRDKGAAAAPATLTIVDAQATPELTFAALQAAQAIEGGGVVCPSIACVKWWTAPSGDLHADIRGETAGGYVETAPEIVARIVAARSTIPFADGAVAAAAAARPAVFGWRVDSDGATAAAEISDMLGGVSTSWLLVDGKIVFRHWDWTAPTRVARSFGAPIRKGTVKPTASRKLGYRRNWSPMARGDLAAIVLSTDVLYEDGQTIEDLKPATPGATAGAPEGTTVGGVVQPDGSIVGGRPAEQVIDDLDRVNSDLDITRGEVDILTPSLFDLAKIANTINTYMRARTTLDGKPIGTVVVDVRTVTESAVEELHLIGAKNGDGTAFLLNMNTVEVADGVSLSQRFEQTEAEASDAIEALSTSVSEAMASAAESVASQIETVQAQFTEDIGAATQSTMQAVTDGDHALAERIDEGEANFEQFSADFETYRQGVASELGATSEAIDTVKAEIEGDDGIAAQVGFLRSATVTPAGDAVAKAVLSLKAGNRVGGLIATNDGTLALLDLDFDVVRMFKPDGSLLFLAGPAGEVYMPSVRVDTLVAGAINFEFTGDRQLLDPAGWVQELPGGFIMMGGQYRASLSSETSISIVYPRPFPLQTLAYGANGYNSNGNNRKDLFPQNYGAPSPSGASFYMQAPNDNAIALDGFDWWAWGR